ncbi:MAG: dihydropteroate synthase [Jaaginema sp. PMC 1079.18]|nr:dihydropteroate synthase [Jaaginema sp. PMC 1080.18]MEC4854082.1 dihydropteroate synthase [Jaaginema sp. PMC 1079.18]MEC4868590.1 dihydropteroate synthase [Jaaginema sp. PMC 1078.18]
MTIQPTLEVRNKIFAWGQQTYLMGILNVTPDSFSDGGEYNNEETALAQAKLMIEKGTDIIDIGGQSTRPGSTQISLETELNRVIPVIEKIRAESQIPISIDTTRAEVARVAIASGADIINDISGGTYDCDMLSITAELDVPIILMHLRGTPKTMQTLTDYQDLIAEIYGFFERQIAKCRDLKIPRSHLIIDPGIGFAKTAEQNLEILRNLSQFKKLNVPLLMGVSRKSFIGKILQQDNPKERVFGTAAACCAAIANQADILRVHDIPEMFDVVRVADAIWRN